MKKAHAPAQKMMVCGFSLNGPAVYDAFLFRYSLIMNYLATFIALYGLDRLLVRIPMRTPLGASSRIFR